VQNLTQLHKAVKQLHCVSIKNSHFYFSNNYVKHWLILIISGTQHQEKTWR